MKILGRKHDNVAGVMWLALSESKTSLTKTELLEYLYAHPYYPSLKSVCDTFKKWNIDNYAVELEVTELIELEKPFIAHMNIGSGQIVFVKSISKEKIWFSFGESRLQSDTIENFSKVFSGVVILFERIAGSKHKGYKDSRQSEILEKSVIPISIVCILLFLTHQLVQSPATDLFPVTLRTVFLYLTKLSGLVVSLLLVLHELRITSPLIDKICHINKNTDCNAVLNSQSSKIYGWLGWADFGFIYFIGTLGFIIFSYKSGLDLLAMLSLMAVPYPVYSIYIQAFRIRRFCPLCLTVQVILLAEFLILLPYLSGSSLSYKEVISLCTCLGLTGLIYLLVRYLKKVEIEYNILRKKYLRFKSNPVIFRHLYLKQKQISGKDIPDRLILGNSEAPVRINAFLSLYCQPCAKAFGSLAAILKETDEIQINLIISGNDNLRSNSFIEKVYQGCKNFEQDKAIDLISGWYQNLKSYSANRTDTSNYESGNNQMFKDNQKLFKEYGINGTPTLLIGNRELPVNYSISDLEYFIDDIRHILTEKEKAGGY